MSVRRFLLLAVTALSMFAFLSSDSALAACSRSAEKNQSTTHDDPFFPDPVPSCAWMTGSVSHRDQNDCAFDAPGAYPEGGWGGDAWTNGDGTYTVWWNKDSGDEKCGSYVVRIGWTGGTCAPGGGAALYVGYPTSCAPPCSAKKGNACTPASPVTNACGMPGAYALDCNENCVLTPGSIPSDAKCPVGTFNADCSSPGSAVAYGTASDPDYAGPATVRIYSPLGVYLAPDAIGNAPKPNWVWNIPPALKTGIAKNLYAFVQNVDQNNVQEGPWVPLPFPPLSGPPTARTLTCDDPPVVTIAATCSTANGNATDSGAGSVPVTIYDGNPLSGGKKLTATPLPAATTYALTFPAFTDGETHTLYATAPNLPTGNPVMTPVASSPVPCPAAQPVNVVITRSDFCAADPYYSVAWSSTTKTQKGFRLEASTDGTFGTVEYRYESPIVASPGSWWMRLMEWMGLRTSAKADSPGLWQIPMKFLAYGKRTYYVRVQVVGSSGVWSPWSAVSTFETPVRPYPAPSFTWEPQQIFAGIPVTFKDTSEPEPIIESHWTIIRGGDTAELDGRQVSYPFPSEGDYTVTLRTTNDAGTCTSKAGAGQLQSGKGLPIFREVRPGSRPSPTPTSGASRP